MDQFAFLGSLVTRLHGEFHQLYYLLLPLFFAGALMVSWFQGMGARPDFLGVLKRVVLGTLLLVAFPEITNVILLISEGLTKKISDMSGLDSFIEIASQKTKDYTLSPTTLLVGFNDLMISMMSFGSYVFLYAARYITVAMYHFSWAFLVLLAPFILLFNAFTNTMTMGLFRSLIEIASWRVVWAVLSAILTALPFGQSYQVEGGYVTIAIINFVIAICMLGTPLVVHSLVGHGFASVAGTISAMAQYLLSLR